ncbi:MAG: cytochrome c3 family protein [Candidatus Bathyarchaeota archaeon]|nr:cytochrome c3 family protein [Candidatus Bathyarchaeota archaeon]
MKKVSDTNSPKIIKSTKVIFFILTITFLMVIIATVTVTVMGETSEEYMGAGYCAGCHSTESEHWSSSPHADASSNAEFLEDWEELDSSVSCLSCHTTGFDEDTNTFETEGVTCEACHGPGDTMERDTSPELCGECHSGPYPTYEEWKDSGPSHGNADCLLCHDQHTAELKFETSTGTCGQCHDTHVDQVLDTVHGETDVECADCHMIEEPADFVKGTPAKTGHSFSLTEHELDCSTCHDRPLSKHDVLGEKAYACLSCHGDIHELKLELVNREVYPLDNSVPLCAQCHNERYTAWEQGTHGEYDDPEAQCTECHDPHDPIITGISTLESIPPRVAAKPAPILPLIVVAVVVELLFIAVFVFRRQSNV